jgi:hypothetical protein
MERDQDTDFLFALSVCCSADENGVEQFGLVVRGGFLLLLRCGARDRG